MILSNFSCLTKPEEMKAPSVRSTTNLQVHEDDIAIDDILLGRGGKTNHHAGALSGVALCVEVAHSVRSPVTGSRGTGGAQWASRQSSTSFIVCPHNTSFLLF